MKFLIFNHKRITGFTLIEVLLVIVLIGLMVSAIQFSVIGNKAETQLQQESARFAGIFELAAEYGLLNNIELGLVLEKNSYQFVGYDGERWSALPDYEALGPYQLPDEIIMSLILEDLPIEQPSLVTAELFAIEDEEFFDDYSLDEQQSKPIIPQVYILSSGDITPFRAEFSLAEIVDAEQQVQFHVMGQYTSPLTIAGPLFNGESATQYAQRLGRNE